MAMMVHAWMSLQEVLQALGYRARKKGNFGTKEIVSSSNQVVFAGRSGQVWEWLRKTKQIA